MSLPLTFRPIAEEEFDDAAAWYEGQRPGLGAEFVAAVQQVLDEIAARPGRFPAESGDTREAPIRRFPCCVYYRTRPGRVVVIAVLHTSRDPAVWQSRS